MLPILRRRRGRRRRPRRPRDRAARPSSFASRPWGRCRAIVCGFASPSCAGQGEGEGRELAAGDGIEAAGRELGREAALAAALSHLHRRVALDRRAARPGREGVVGQVGAAAGGVASGARGPPKTFSLRLLTGTCGRPPRVSIPLKTVVTWPVSGFGFDLGRQLQVHALFVGDDPEAEEMPGLGGALVDGAVQGLFERRDLGFDRADLRRLGAVGDGSFSP